MNVVARGLNSPTLTCLLYEVRTSEILSFFKKVFHSFKDVLKLNTVNELAKKNLVLDVVKCQQVKIGKFISSYAVHILKMFVVILRILECVNFLWENLVKLFPNSTAIFFFQNCLCSFSPHLSRLEALIILVRYQEGEN